MSALPEATGTIYDIGYRRYDGPRLGRAGAITAIVGAGIRSVFGLGRSGRSKIIPWGAVILALLPAVVGLAMRVLAGEALQLFTYQGYLWEIGAILWIFLAAQAPELVVNDIRHHVLPLYFSRPISRLDYAAAKLAALTLSLLVLTLVPVLVMLVGTILAGEDLVGAMGDELPALPGILGNGLLHAVVLASIGLAISSISGRRAYAAGGIVALFLIGAAVSGIFAAQGQLGRQGLADIAPFFNPLAILDGTRQWLFGETVSQSPIAGADLPLFVYGIAAAVIVLVCWAILAVRYRRVAT